MSGEDCVDHPKCREDLIKRINLRMQTKTFWTALGSVLGIIGIILTLVYISYAAEKKTIEDAVNKQTEIVQKSQRKLTEIEVNQRHVMDKQNDFKKQIQGMENNQRIILQEVIKIREYQVNGN